MTITQAISIKIAAKVAEGMDIMSALKAVCGEANVDRMIDELYHELRARAS